MDFPSFVHTILCARVVHLGATQYWGTGQKLQLNNLISTYEQSYNTPDSVSVETSGVFRPCLRIYFSSISRLQAVLCHADYFTKLSPSEDYNTTNGAYMVLTKFTLKSESTAVCWRTCCRFWLAQKVKFVWLFLQLRITALSGDLVTQSLRKAKAIKGTPSGAERALWSLEKTLSLPRTWSRPYRQSIGFESVYAALDRVLMTKRHTVMARWSTYSGFWHMLH